MFSFLRRNKMQEHPAFPAMPATMVTAGPARLQLAVHMSGRTGGALPPLICIGGYTRNMLDFADFIRNFRAQYPERSVATLDLPGRGRSAHLSAKSGYSSLHDAGAAISAITAMGIGRCILVGQGHGGQVAMLIARAQPSLLAGVVLIDAGPVTDPRGIVRVRSNVKHIAALKSGSAMQDAARKTVAADYPGESEARLDALIARQYRQDGHGRLVPLFDTRLIAQLEQFDFDDVLEPQWPLFDALSPFPLMLVRTQLSDQLRRETFEEMARRRSDAARITISGTGSPALLDEPEELRAIGEFCASIGTPQAAEEEVA
ncbi:alpha/beta hydrolase [Pelagibacterium limicola]|uniref:alpha/beta hydrolase n=1 Tax=Pelagibacterium limicola TaxID=2791022 RepID=UPI0018AFECA4|nr:alpha/beta hydrolase [Pelagibacterium limicola]